MKCHRYPRARTARAVLRSAVWFLLLLLLFLVPLADSCAAQNAAANELDRLRQREVIAQVSTVLRERYVFPEVAERIAAGLQAAERRGEFVALTDPAAFARALTDRIQRIGQDGHLWLMVQPGEHPEPVREPDAEAVAAQRRALARSNFGLPHAQILPGNVGYLKIRQFVAPELGRDAAVAAMRFLANVDALILDLRQSMGGSPAMVAFLASYLFGEEPVHLFDIYWRPEARTDAYRTERSLPGARLEHQPVYILTASSTFSAGEGLAYTLKHLGRATVVGEKTAGGAHPGRFHRVSRDLVMFVAEARVTSPVTGENWEGSGVTPQVQGSAGRALERAHLLALEALQAAHPGGELAAQREAIAEEIRQRLAGEDASR